MTRSRSEAYEGLAIMVCKALLRTAPARSASKALKLPGGYGSGAPQTSRSGQSQQSGEPTAKQSKSGR
jgi:hypothetical protein